MILSIIGAIGKNRELGKNNRLIWNMPNDMKYFRDTTRGHAVIMGRKTFEAIGKPLPNRENVVVTGDRHYQAEGVIIVHSLEEAILRYNNTDQEVFVIGGSQLYTQALPLAEKLYITKIDGTFDADTFFPEWNESSWELASEETHTRDQDHAFPYTFAVYKKRP